MNTTGSQHTHRGALLARDIMSDEPVCVPPSASIRELARLFEEHEISGAPVVNAQGRVIGVVSKSDLIRRCSSGHGDIPPSYLFEILSQPRETGAASEIIPEPLLCVGDLMTESPVTALPDSPLAHLARLLVNKHVHRVIITDVAGHALGIVTSLDLLTHFPEANPKHSCGCTSGSGGCRNSTTVPSVNPEDGRAIHRGGGGCGCKRHS